jgi:hypothetical protein
MMPGVQTGTPHGRRGAHRFIPPNTWSPTADNCSDSQNRTDDAESHRLQQFGQHLRSESAQTCYLGGKNKMSERKLIHDEAVKRYRCDTCGWKWEIPPVTPGEKPLQQTLKDDFSEHQCSEYPMQTPVYAGGPFLVSDSSVPHEHVKIADVVAQCKEREDAKVKK